MTQTPGPRPPQRTETHRIDTLAVRKLFTKLSPDWIIRDLSERDYGIDLMLEYYADNNPTGQVVFFQVKGKSAAVEISDGIVKYQMKKQTLLYAELFPEPFLLVHTSIDQAGQVFYVWLQKYISHVLDRDRPRWRNESNETISIQFPATNTFEDAEEKLISISKSNVLLTESLQFLSTYMFWEFNYSELTNGNHDFTLACLEHLNEFKQLCTLFRKYNQDSLPDFNEVADCIETYDLNDASGHYTISQFSELLELIKTAVLTARHQEQFMEETLGEVPY
jgi:hypothetical protein